MTDAFTNAFDVDALHRLVDEALHGAARPRTPDLASPAVSASVTTTGAGTAGVFFAESQWFEQLADVLPQYLSASDTQAVLGAVRDATFATLDRSSLRELHTVVKHCRRCPAVTPEPQLPTGNLAQPDVVFVDLLPGVADATRTAVLDAGFAPSRIAFTSCVRCLPISEPGLRGATPSPREVQTCTRSYLFAELQLWAPRLIVTFGTGAYQAVLGDAVPLNEARGQLVWLGPWAVLPMHAVGYGARRPDAAPLFAQDLRRAYEFCYGRDEPSPADALS